MRYQISDEGGNTLVVEADKAPSQADAEEIFSHTTKILPETPASKSPDLSNVKLNAYDEYYAKYGKPEPGTGTVGGAVSTEFLQSIPGETAQLAKDIFPHISDIKHATSQSVISDVVLSPLRAASIPFRAVPPEAMEFVEKVGADVLNIPFIGMKGGGEGPFKPGEPMLPKVETSEGSSLTKIPEELYNQVSEFLTPGNVALAGAIHGVTKAVAPYLAPRTLEALKSTEKGEPNASTITSANGVAGNPPPGNIEKVAEGITTQNEKPAQAQGEVQKEVNPEWQVSVQAPQDAGGGKIVPGYVQIDDVTGGQNNWSKSADTLAKEGYKVPDYSSLPQGKYTVAQANELLKGGESNETKTQGQEKGVLNTLSELSGAGTETPASITQTAPVQPSLTPEMVGMGGAVPKEFETSPKTPTSIKNAVVDQERASRGLPPAVQAAKRSFGEVWDQTMAKVDQDPGYQDRLINELRDNPRALTDSEDAALLHRQIDLQNEYGKATRDLAQAYDDGRMEAANNENVRVQHLRDQLYDLYEITKKVGTETGRGLNARKMLAYEDYTLAKMELEKRAANEGRPLTDEQAKEVADLHKRIAETQKAYDDYVAKNTERISDLEAKRALDKIEIESRVKASPQIVRIAEKIVSGFETRADAARARLREKMGRTSAGVDPTILTDLTEIGAAHLARAALDFTKWSAKMVGEFGDWVKPHLEEVFKASQKLIDDAEKTPKSGERIKASRAARAEGDKIGDQIKAKVDEGQEGDISPQAQKLAKMFVEMGVKDRNELIDAVHGELQKYIPEITRREAMDAISGYGKFKQLTKDEISVKLRDLKGQMQQVAKLEDMQANQPPLKTGIERRIPSLEERELIRKVNEAKNQFQIPINDPNTQLKSSLDTLKTRLKNQTEMWEKKLKEGDFQKKPKRTVQMDAEANRLSFENAKAKAKWHEALMKDRLANQTIGQKILRGTGEVANTARAVMTAFDLSAVLRQGGFIAIGHPLRALKSFPGMFRAFASERGAHAINEQILNRPNYPEYTRSKLYLSEHGQKLSQMEEAYMSRWAERIPGVGASQRAYTTFLNKLRADSFDAMAASLKKGGELTPEESKAIANFINVSTGRGSLGMKENALVGLNTVFFAPRYVASRFQMLAGQPLYRGTARTRIAIAKEYGRYLIGMGVIYGLAKMDGADVETDPRSSDFGKIRYGDTRLDPLSGLQQSTVLLSRLGSGETKRLSGEVVPIRGENVPYGAGNSADVMARFLRTKLAPIPGAGVDLLTGRNVVGQPVTLGSEALGTITPLAMSDVFKAMQEQGVERGTALSLLGVFGMGLQTFNQDQK